MRTIRTARLRLVPVTFENALSLWRLLQQPDLRAYQDLPAVGAAIFSEMVAKRPALLAPEATGRFEWIIQLSGARLPVGWVSLRIADRDPNSGEIGYSILREYRRRGIATEAVRVLISEAFACAKLARVYAYCVPENQASRAVLERVGFQFETRLPHGATVNGQMVDVLMHRIDRADWDQSGNSIEMPASAYPA